VHFLDYTMMRALAMDFGNDTKVFDIKDQWMLGPSLMACPVSQYKARSRKVYFPAGRGWYDLYTGRHITGGQQQEVDAPYERIPVFVPEGSIIPFGPAMEWTDEKAPELINLYVYAGRDAQFTLYEDEGTNYNYEEGQYATIRLLYDDTRRTLTIDQRQGSFKGMLEKRRFNIVYVTPANAQALNLESPTGKMIAYQGKTVTIQLFPRQE
jgi:alpha-D-xyloside xylohydrolase